MILSRRKFEVVIPRSRENLSRGEARVLQRPSGQLTGKRKLTSWQAQASHLSPQTGA